MKLVFISLMEGSPWGGSEELWSKVANEAIIKNDKVFISYKFWDKPHFKLESLLQKGAIVFFRKDKFVKNSIIRLSERILSKFFKKKIENGIG